MVLQYYHTSLGLAMPSRPFEAHKRFGLNRTKHFLDPCPLHLNGRGVASLVPLKTHGMLVVGIDESPGSGES